MLKIFTIISTIAVLIVLQVSFGTLEQLSSIVVDKTQFLHEISPSNLPGPLRALNLEKPLVELDGREVYEETNVARVENDLPPLAFNQLLQDAAHIKAQDMLTHQYFEHVSPQGVGPSDVVARAEYDFLIVAENLAMGRFENEAALLEAWMNSPGHRANILHEKVTEIGIAVVQGEYEGNEIWMAVQEFGLPTSACPGIAEEVKGEIDRKQNEIEELRLDLNDYKERIDNTPKEEQRSESYRELVEEYNEAVAKHNALVSETKGLVDTYNTSIRSYNECIERVK